MGRRAAEKPYAYASSPSGSSSGSASRALRPFRLGHVLALGALPALTLALAHCYSTGDGAPPPLASLYYPVGLQVSAGGTVLYAINSDFDLQYNGGTLQSYDLARVRRDAVVLSADPLDPSVTSILDRDRLTGNPCPSRASSLPTPGESCAPPVDSSFYVRDTAIIGAFATDLVLSRPPSALVPQVSRPAGEAVVCPSPAFGPATAGCPGFGTRTFDRLFAPVRGNASVTWATVERDGLTSIAPQDPNAYAPFKIQCGKDSSGRCDGAHSVGTDPNEAGNSRHITMPGEPFGIAVSPDGESILVTHQNETKVSLFSSGLGRNQDNSGRGDDAPAPFLQFVLDGVPYGGVGVAAIPHDRDGFPGSFPRPAFLETSRSVGQVSVLRQYPDEFGGVPSAVHRPFLDLEAGFPVTIGAGGSDSRGIVVDPTPRIACKAKVVANPVDPTKGRTQDVVNAELLACARKPARVFIANRSPASLLVGELGGSANAQDDYDADRLVIHSTIPLSAGPSKLYLAPVVERDGAYALRVFAVCFDAATVFVYDPDAEQVESVLRTGLGPFAMAFDPFDMVDVATHAKAPIDTRHPETPGLKQYRFAYLASFTNSFIQLIDLDNDQGNANFERIVFTLGRPTTPKGS